MSTKVYRRVIRILEQMESNLSVRGLRGGPGHAYRKHGYRRVYGRSEHDDTDEVPEIEPDDGSIKVSKAFEKEDDDA